MFKAKFELSFENKFDAVIVNDDLSQAIGQAEQLVNNFLADDVVVA